jgi:folate-dependent phosphoribosylglycinamide formyltransferase PurN
MKVLLFGSETSSCEATREFLTTAGEDVRLWTQRPSVELVHDFSPDLIVSYGFRWLLSEEIFTFPRFGTVNAHISYLPWNRGADPNFWSHAEGTPKGVSLHYIDKGIDTGALIIRELIDFEEGDTLRTSYDKLHAHMRGLLTAWWPAIRKGHAPRLAQEPGGTSHLRKHLDPFGYALARRGWDTPVREIAALALEHDTIHGEYC